MSNRYLKKAAKLTILDRALWGYGNDISARGELSMENINIISYIRAMLEDIDDELTELQLKMDMEEDDFRVAIKRYLEGCDE